VHEIPTPILIGLLFDCQTTDVGFRPSVVGEPDVLLIDGDVSHLRVVHPQKEPDELTMNVISFAGMKMEMLERTGMVGRDGYAKVTLWSASSPEHLTGVIFLRTRSFLDCGVDVARETRETINNFSDT